MNEQHVRTPEQFVIPSKKELRPGAMEHSLHQDPNNPLVSAQEMRKLTGLDLPATMAIEFGEGANAQRLLVVPVERGREFNADYLVVNPDLMSPDDPNSLNTGVGFKGLRSEEGSVAFGTDERVNARLGLEPGESPWFRIQVDDKGDLHLGVNQHSPKKLTVAQPVVYERPLRAQAEAPAFPSKSQPTLEQRLSPEVERPAEPTADEIFASPEAFMAALDNKNLSQATRLELIQIMSLSDKRESVQRITELWESSLGEPLRNQLEPLAKGAVQESAYLYQSFGRLESLAREIIADPEQAAHNLDELMRAIQVLPALLEQQPQSDQFFGKVAEFMQQDGRLEQVQEALASRRMADDPARLEALVASRKPEEKELADIRLRLKDEYEEEPGAMLVGQRKNALLSVNGEASRPSPTNLQLANTLRDFSVSLHYGGVEGGVEAVRQFLYSGDLEKLGEEIKTKLHRAQAVADAFA